MNREIKFRAWDRKFNRIFDVVEIIYEYTFVLVWRNPFKDEHINWIGSGLIAGEECDLMQYIGLKDINGVEVYEGDVLHLRGHQTFVVTFSDASFVARSTNKVQRINWTPSIMSRIIEMGYKVIGNIYENPELMNL